MKRAGYSLLELIVALTLGALLAAAAATLLHGHVQLSRSAGARMQRTETLRTIAQVLAAETRWLDPLRDVQAWSADSIALRAFRAVATVCGFRPDGTSLVRLEGMRAPDAAKDSVLIVRRSEEVGARVVFVATDTTACAGSATHALLLNTPTQAGDLLLLFEAGSYFLSERALRYRLGQEGRQPLTTESLDDRKSAFIPQYSAAFAVLAVAGPGSLDVRRLRLPFLNYFE